jgi:hypothetical protein
MNSEVSPESRHPPMQPHLTFHTNHLLEPQHPPLSPRAMPVADLTQRRPSHPSLLSETSARQHPQPPPPAASFRGVAPHLSISPRRYGSIGSANNTYSPASSRAPPPPPPPSASLTPHPPQQQSQHPLATVSSPPANLSRRHTAADIRSPGWDHIPASTSPALPSPFGNSTSHQPGTGQWPSPPRGTPGDSADRTLCDHLAAYQLPPGPSSSQQQRTPPPPPSDPVTAVAGTGPESAWQVPGRPAYPTYIQSSSARASGVGYDTTSSGGPPTRRSSMASNLHGLLNPAGGESGGDEDGPEGSTKRKRLG